MRGAQDAEEVLPTYHPVPRNQDRALTAGGYDGVQRAQLQQWDAKNALGHWNHNW